MFQAGCVIPPSAGEGTTTHGSLRLLDAGKPAMVKSWSQDHVYYRVVLNGQVACDCPDWVRAMGGTAPVPEAEAHHCKHVFAVRAWRMAARDELRSAGPARPQHIPQDPALVAGLDSCHHCGDTLAYALISARPDAEIYEFVCPNPACEWREGKPRTIQEVRLLEQLGGQPFNPPPLRPVREEVPLPEPPPEIHLVQTREATELFGAIAAPRGGGWQKHQAAPAPAPADDGIDWADWRTPDQVEEARARAASRRDYHGSDPADSETATGLGGAMLAAWMNGSEQASRRGWTCTI